MEETIFVLMCRVLNVLLSIMVLGNVLRSVMNESCEQNQRIMMLQGIDLLCMRVSVSRQVGKIDVFIKPDTYFAQCLCSKAWQALSI